MEGELIVKTTMLRFATLCSRTQLGSPGQGHPTLPADDIFICWLVY
jgi:hypothetical protein